MKAALLRLARILVAQIITWAIATWGGISVPVINITIGAVINAVFKFLRDKFPTAIWLAWLPL